MLELNTLQKVASYFESLREQDINIIAVDIECEMNLHRYGEHLCLIQIFDQKDKVIIDPLTFENKEELRNVLRLVFESRNILKITYDMAGDASIIEKLHGVKFKSALDLKPAVELLKYEKQNLAYILNQELSIPIISKKKFQKYNWMKRPIELDAMNYAISDVMHLFKLKDKLLQKILENGLLDKYILSNLMAQNKEYVEPAPEETYKKRKGYNRLSRKDKNKYRRIYDLRDKYAQKINRPPHFLISNDNLLVLANYKEDSLRIVERLVTQRMNKTLRKNFVDNLIKMLEHVCD